MNITAEKLGGIQFPYIHRHTMRGYKRCKHCGKYSGQRAKICSNESCELRRKVLESIKPFDPVQLVVHQTNVNGFGTSMYSLRSKLNNVQRNFVQIKEETLAVEHNSSIISRNAICFVDNCKYDAADATEISCKHIKACTPDPNKQNWSLPKAEVYTIAQNILWDLNIDDEQKQRLWSIYKEDELVIPAVQRLNSTSFVVKCKHSKIFPAGRLHVTVVSNLTSSKKCTQSCSCKKLKIIVEPDDSVVMEEDICDHLLLVLAAILSKQEAKNMYGNFLNALKSFWKSAPLEPLILDGGYDDTLFGMNINIGGDFITNNGDTSSSCADDILILADEFLKDTNVSDFSDLILSLTTDEQIPNFETNSLRSTIYSNSTKENNSMHIGDPNFVSNCNTIEDENDMKFNMNALSTNTLFPLPSLLESNQLVNATNMEQTCLELSDCNIELMDQFQLTDQIDLCSADIATSTEEVANIFHNNGISILPSSLCIDQQTNIQNDVNQTSLIPTTNNTYQNIENKSPSKNISFLKSNQNGASLPLIEMPTIAVVKKTPIKASEIVKSVKTRKFPQIPAKRSLIINNQLKNQSNCTIKSITKDHSASTNNDEEKSSALSQGISLSYSAWLDYIIEVINESININGNIDIKHTFHVHEEIFAQFSKSFSAGIKRRMPNNVVLLKNGKYKGLMKYVWHFTTASTVRRIFSTTNISIEIERPYTRNPDGTFTPYTPQSIPKIDENDKKNRRIYPKLELYFTYIWFECSNNKHRTGFKMEWLPNAYPKSHFGILDIEFSLGIREPNSTNM